MFNNIEELKGIGEASWQLISSIYNSGWDSLFADKNNNSFRQKISFMCTPKVNSIKSRKRTRIPPNQ